MKFKLLLIASVLMSIDTQGCFAMEDNINLACDFLACDFLVEDMVSDNTHQSTSQLLKEKNKTNETIENAFMCFVELNMRNPNNWKSNMRFACTEFHIQLSTLDQYVKKHKKELSYYIDTFIYSSIKTSISNLPHTAECGYSALIQSSYNDTLYNSKITLLDALLTKLNDENTIARKLIAQEIIFYITAPATKANIIIKNYFWDNIGIFDEIMRTVNDDYHQALFAAEAPGVAESYITLLRNAQIPMSLPGKIGNDSFTGICDAIAHSCFKTNLVIVDRPSGNILHQYLVEFPKTTYIISISDPETGLQHFQTWRATY